MEEKQGTEWIDQRERELAFRARNWSSTSFLFLSLLSIDMIKRGAMVKALAIGTKHPFIQVFKVRFHSSISARVSSLGLFSLC